MVLILYLLGKSAIFAFITMQENLQYFYFNPLLVGVLPVHDGGADDRGGERAGGLPLPHPVQAQHQQERR